MKARWLTELRQLVASPELEGWWSAFARARDERDEALARHREALAQEQLTDFRAELIQKDAIDTLNRADAHSDAAAAAHAAAQELENQSLETVALFEEQRFRATEAWYKTCSAERRVEQARERLAGRNGSATETSRLKADLKRAEKAQAQAVEDSERENAEKARLWAVVEAGWDRSMELGLLTAEERRQAGQVRASAERLFLEADERKRRADELGRQSHLVEGELETAEARLQGLLAEAQARFGCSPGREFLYFRQREDPARAHVVALIEDATSYNIEVRPLAVLSLDAKRGVDFLEPAVERHPTDEEGDRRFEAFFLEGRLGARTAD